MTQEWFGFYEYEEREKGALKARNARLKELRSSGVEARGMSLPGQLHKYSGFGQPDGSVGTVYGIEIVRGFENYIPKQGRY